MPNGEIDGKNDFDPNKYEILIDCSDDSCRMLLQKIELELETMMPGTILKAIGGCRCERDVIDLSTEIGDEFMLVLPKQDGNTCEYFIIKGGR